MALTLEARNNFFVQPGDTDRRDRAAGCELKTARMLRDGQYGRKQYEAFELPLLNHHVHFNGNNDQDEDHDENKRYVHWLQNNATPWVPSSSCEAERALHNTFPASSSNSSRSSSASVSSLGGPTETDSASSLTTLFPHNQLDSSVNSSLLDESNPRKCGSYDASPWITSSVAERGQFPSQDQDSSQRESILSLHSTTHLAFNDSQLESCGVGVVTYSPQRRMAFSVLEAAAHTTAVVVVAMLCAVSVWLTLSDLSL